MFGAMDRNGSIVWAALLLQLFMTTSSLSQTTESTSTLPLSNSQAGRCSRNLQHTFDPLLETMIDKIKLELSSMQQGTQVMISNENDLATLVAEKLFDRIKDDLFSSGTSIITEELNDMKETIANLQAEKSTVVHFSAYKDNGNGGYITGPLTFNNVLFNYGSSFDGSAFTAPISGFYSFQISGQQGTKDGRGTALNLMVKRNEEHEFHIIDFANGSNYQNLHYKFELKLEQGDKISLELHDADYLMANGAHRVYFSGQLLYVL